MKKLNKGTFGYLKKRKSRYLLYALAEFLVVFAVFGIGILQTGTRKNILTIVAVVGCLPASKMLVEYVVMAPYKGAADTVKKDLDSIANHMTVLYDLLVSSSEKMMFLDAAVISGQVLCGYISSGKTNEKKVTDHLKKTLTQSGYDKVTVKLFRNYNDFLARTEEMEKLALTRQKDTRKTEAAIAGSVLTTCM